jgi:uncharacterized membrane protein
VTIAEKRWVNRGFMRGPFIPLYGCAGVMMLVISKPYYDNLILVYLAGCVGATVLEYATGVIMEALFKVRYWDYSHKKFNYKGHICLESSLFWGVPTVVFTHYLQVPIEKVVMSIPGNILSIATIVTTVLFSCDFMLAFKTAIELRDILIYMEKARDEMKRIQRRLDAIIAFRGEAVKEGISSTVEGIGDKVGNIGAGISDRVGDLSSGISDRIDALGSTLGKSFGVLREKIRLNPSGYVENVKEEVMELYSKYCILMDRLTPRPVRSFFDWYRNRTIAGNPTMVSDEFKQSLEEIKEKIAKYGNFSNRKRK